MKMRKVENTPTSVRSNKKLSIQNPLEVETATKKALASGDPKLGSTKPTFKSFWDVGEEVVVVPFSSYHYTKHQGMSYSLLSSSVSLLRANNKLVF